MERVLQGGGWGEKRQLCPSSWPAAGHLALCVMAQRTGPFVLAPSVLHVLGTADKSFLDLKELTRQGSPAVGRLGGDSGEVTGVLALREPAGNDASVGRGRAGWPVGQGGGLGTEGMAFAEAGQETTGLPGVWVAEKSTYSS